MFCQLKTLPLWFALAALLSAAKPVEPQERQDLRQSFAAIVCKEGTIPSALPFTLWQNGIYDAQIEGQVLRRRNGLPGRLPDAEDAARQIAKARRYRGTVTGTCDDGAIFAAATPSSLPLKVKGSLIELPLMEIASHCQDWRMDYVATESGKPRRLVPTGQSVETRSLKPGTLSVTCQPSSPRWQGPVLWFLAPIGTGPEKSVPELTDAAGLASFATPGVSPEALQDALGLWLNRIRSREGLKPVIPSVALREQAELLSIDGNLTHNRILLQRSVEKLAESQWHFLGEDRVKGSNLGELAWLLWNSPRHRDLLLNDVATGYGIGLKKIGPQVFAVIVMGDGPTKIISQGEPAKPKTTKRQ